jgi:hypothetical protein
VIAANHGHSYGFERADTSWEQTEVFESPNDTGPNYIRAVALQEDAAFVSYVWGDGYVRVFDRQPIGWEEEPQTLWKDMPDYDSFGTSIAVDGTTAVIGAQSDETESGRTGAAFVYERRDDGEWSRRLRLVPAVGRPGDTFGAAVGISGSTVVVGAPTTESDASGSAYVFEL